ncbi:TPA: hypothetical protein EYP66_10600 [Candidatus Poribacteria bacterium]|nr:hypothetical protein [Candidatus Poribacteria bacterium]
MTTRAIILTLLLLPLSSLWIIQQETVRYTFPTWFAPISNVVFIVMLLMLLDKILAKLFRRNLLSQSEFLMVYFLLSIGACICSDKIGHHLVEFMVHAQWFATQENEWMELFGNHLPKWVLVNNQKAIRLYYEGGTTVYQWNIIRPWLAPALLWSGFLVVLMFVLLCLNTFLRRQWTEEEKLAYPAIQLPLQMTEPKSTFFRNNFMWLGFSLATFISLVNGLHFLIPQVPYIPVKRRSFGYLFTTRPWNAMGDVRLSFYPFMIGLTFLMPLDILLSAWVFYLGYKAQLITKAIAGWHKFPHYTEQSFGAYFAIAFFTLWLGRYHFNAMLRHGLGLRIDKRYLDEESEMMRYRTAFWLMMSQYYSIGAISGRFGPWPRNMVDYLYRRLQNWLNYPTPPDYVGMWYMAGGFLLGALMYWLRMRFFWWQLHPLGYAMANSWAMHNFWSCLFVAFLIKWILLRFAGLGAYRKAVPFFLGLAFGDFMLGSLWSAAGITLDMPMYEFWP